MKIVTLHIIHLPHRIDRRKLVLEELQSQGIFDFVFWKGFHDVEKPSRGIAKAHQQIVAWAAEQRLPEVMIAEDDVEFTGPGAFQYYLAGAPAEYDLYLGGISYGKINDDYTVDDFAGTHLYTIRKRFYETFLSLTGVKDIDRALAKKGTYSVCHPMVAIQRDGYSDNVHEYRNNKQYFEDRKLWRGPAC